MWSPSMGLPGRQPIRSESHLSANPANEPPVTKGRTNEGDGEERSKTYDNNRGERLYHENRTRQM